MLLDTLEMLLGMAKIKLEHCQEAVTCLNVRGCAAGAEGGGRSAFGGRGGRGLYRQPQDDAAAQGRCAGTLNI